jgi:hypothetical protein
MFFVCLFIAAGTIFQLSGGCDRAANLGLCSALRAFEQGGIFIVPHQCLINSLSFISSLIPFVKNLYSKVQEKNDDTLEKSNSAKVPKVIRIKLISFNVPDVIRTNSRIVFEMIC